MLIDRVGFDIDGFIECRPWIRGSERPQDIPWEAAAALDCLNLSRDDNAFGCLFGVSNHAGFRPIAADRGLPADVSDAVRRQHQLLDRGVLGTTWISWAEVRAIDWSEAAEPAGTGRAGRLTRRDAVPTTGAWQPVWDVMAVLGRLHGDAHCRLVVWFEV